MRYVQTFEQYHASKSEPSIVEKHFSTDRDAVRFFNRHMRQLNESTGASNETVIWTVGDVNWLRVLEAYDNGLLEFVKERPAKEPVGDEEMDSGNYRRRRTDAEGHRQFVILIGGPSSGKGQAIETNFGKGSLLTQDMYMAKRGGKEFTTTKEELEFWREVHKQMREQSRKNFAIKGIGPLYTIFDVGDVAEGLPGISEGDALLRVVQQGVATFTFNKLYTEASQGGRTAYEDAIAKAWYKTKDGTRVELSPLMPYEKFMEVLRDHTSSETLRDLLSDRDSFDKLVKESEDNDAILKQIMGESDTAEPVDPGAFKAFFKATNAGFYKSMRGWQDGAFGGSEQFKEAAKKEFLNVVNSKSQSDMESSFIVIDSPGEDVASQPYVEQCQVAARNGFVTNILDLDSKVAGSAVSFMRLSNLTRKVVKGDRMVDDVDITGFEKNAAVARQKIRENVLPNGHVHRYLHIQRNNPDVNTLMYLALVICTVLDEKRMGDVERQFGKMGLTSEAVKTFEKAVRDQGVEKWREIAEQQFGFEVTPEVFNDVLEVIHIDTNLGTKMNTDKNIQGMWKSVVFSALYGSEWEMAEDSVNYDKKSSELLPSIGKVLMGDDEENEATIKVLRDVADWAVGSGKSQTDALEVSPEQFKDRLFDEGQ